VMICAPQKTEMSKCSTINGMVGMAMPWPKLNVSDAP